jgi:hypothetical protein
MPSVVYDGTDVRHDSNPETQQFANAKNNYVLEADGKNKGKIWR